WGGGGTLGLDTLGGSLERLARARDPALVAAVWITGLLKLGGAGLAPTPVRGLGARAAPPPVPAPGPGRAPGLAPLRGCPVAGAALVATGAIHPAGPVEWKPLLWHLYLWDMSFLVWGILFGLAVWRHMTRLTQ